MEVFQCDMEGGQTLIIGLNHSDLFIRLFLASSPQKEREGDDQETCRWFILMVLVYLLLFLLREASA